ncbi:S-type anion channel SLAH2 isoform X2 [Lotus japonicus]|nr:S-type anion channel SLAH2 isoform X2 [Lotus japonicus]XP_057446142.1 S-type anion channel SLAH2 isoform X2 [Lotus japonicus]XP_057446143.1 S-type anion channel SLAH2 isoform X2 [Lotus japonicus]
MENNFVIEITEQRSPEVPSLIQYISSCDVDGFDTFGSSLPSPANKGHEATSPGRKHDEPLVIKHQRKPSVSMPLSSEEIQLQQTSNKKVYFSGETVVPIPSTEPGTAGSLPPHSSKCYSQPMPKGSAYPEGATNNSAKISNHAGIKMFRDKRFDSFKTWSGTLERQLTMLRGKTPEDSAEDGNSSKRSTIDRPLPVDRYFDALEGPELETLRSSEEIVLPDDSRWPFLLRFPVSSFGICLGVSSQAILWKTLATSPSTEFLHISLKVNLILWIISVALITTVFAIYTLKIILYFEAVRREYYHPIRVNFFFAPWIALLFLAMGVPPSFTKVLHHSLWYILMTPIFCLELKIYGQWMSGGQRRLSKVANPSNHLSIVGNFVGALFGASIGLKEGPIFFFAVGLAHYTVLFVTLYQRLPTNETLPKELHPVFFLFVAAPSVASMAWAKIQGSFDYGSRIAYFIALFLYFSLAVRINFFRGFKFSLAWWAYTFPMTGAAIATIRYSNQVPNVVTKTLCVVLALISTLIVTALLVSTILHAFVFRDLFPNDIAIAISDRKRKPHKKWLGFRHGSQDAKEIENFLKFVNPDEINLEDITPVPHSSESGNSPCV